MKRLELVSENLHGAGEPRPEDARCLCRYLTSQLAEALFAIEGLVSRGKLRLDDPDAGEEAAYVAFSLVAAWGLVRRARPGWLDLEPFAERIATLLGRQDRVVQKLAASAVDPDGWRQDLEEWLEERTHADLDERTEECLGLVEGLDAALIVCALATAEIAPELRSGVDGCGTLFLAHLDELADAREYVRQTALAIDPDLPATAPELAAAATTLWPALVRAVASAAVEHPAPGFPPAPLLFEQVEALVRGQDAAIRAAVLTPLELPERALVAADRGSTRDADVVVWRGLRLGWRAVLRPPTVGDRVAVVLEGDPLPPGTTVICSGLDAELEDVGGGFGKAIYSYSALQRSDPGLIPALMVRLPDGSVDAGAREAPPR